MPAVKKGEPPAYRWTACFFVRALALIYLAAFFSIAVQIKGLAGQNGILPAAAYLQLVAKHLGPERFWRLPTLAWISAGDAALAGACWTGVILACLLFTGILPGLSALGLWLLYLSLFHAGQEFLSFQWDSLLLESGFLALFLVPWNWREAPAAREPKWPWVILFYRSLLFRLMVGSGTAKWLSGDAAWRNLIALTFHYETTPLPVWTSWYFHHLPAAFHRTSCLIMFFIEIAVPFLIFAGRKGRLACFFVQAAFQLLLIGTGNYAFFNWLTLALCIPLLDDGGLRVLKHLFTKKAPAEAEEAPTSAPASAAPVKRWCGPPAAVTFPVFAVVFLLSVMNFSATLGWHSWPAPLRQWEHLTEPFCLVNRYGLFAVMTRRRPEIIIEGSYDGRSWREYEFRWKPGPVTKRPEFVAPHQPRLDWQMWFAALGNFRSQTWFLFFLKKLAMNSPEVVKLLKTNPFAGEPPRYLRAVLYDYRFTTAEERRRTGAWWKRRPIQLYCPVLARIGSSTFFTGP